MSIVYEPIQPFILIWLPACPHFWVFQNSPKMGKTVYLHASRVHGSIIIQTFQVHHYLLNVGYKQALS